MVMDLVIRAMHLLNIVVAIPRMVMDLAIRATHLLNIVVSPGTMIGGRTAVKAQAAAAAVTTHAAAERIRTEETNGMEAATINDNTGLSE